jgi:hypothetical protein
VIQALGTWVLVVAGWIVVNDQNKHQEVVRANHQRLDSLRSLLDDVEKYALDLHTGAYDDHKVRRIQRLLKKVTIDCRLLVECGALDSDWSGRMIALRQAITLQNFDKSKFEPQLPNSALVGSIELAKDGFETYLASCTSDGLQQGRSLWTSLLSIFGRNQRRA